MGCYIAECLREVMGTGYDTVFTNDNGADGYLAGFIGLLSLGQCLAHIHFILIFLFHDAKVQFFFVLLQRGMENYSY